MPHGWQEVDGKRRSCHWWQEDYGRTVPAMTPTTLVLVPLVLVALVLLVVALVHLVRADGYGTAPPPPDRSFDPRLPTRPYAVR